MADEKTTVGELIAALRQFPTDMRVVVPGIEDGFDDVTVAQRTEAIIGDASTAHFTASTTTSPRRPLLEGDVVESVVVLRYGG